ncbi:AcrR family transcriptional regulator [Actinoplanes octamycinicus]|uniref:AcrR family transcriptional regulator n=1 Tax=Actinoplanes octamycinicus TaxID=135948 RepID=A0A7W7M9M2_9ACTN|nr:TetR/AcrR family transcriptional regulator [Actinoplanes octamycinicus]MBB4742067.1 AcrR family transcriptional regulator [Actinoplanes octamycinicus]GIE63697.1 putative transcriptional regulator, TetR [Actinoplanes octamycinicus]
MTTRREQLLDAAITLLGEGGIHALTHRAVDSQAGLPTGSASNHFRTRDALLDAVVERFAIRERQAWEEIAIRMYPTTPHDLAQVLVTAAKAATGRLRTLTLARYAILVEAGIRPALRAQLLATGSQVNAWFLTWLRVAGSTDPERDAPIIMNHYTGVVLHDLAMPDPAFDPTEQITTLVTTVIRAQPAEAPA